MAAPDVAGSFGRDFDITCDGVRRGRDPGWADILKTPWEGS